jgi:uracil-DNA glycosylase
MDREQIRSYLEFYRDLGIDSVYLCQARQPSRAASDAATEAKPVAQTKVVTETVLPTIAPAGDTLEQIRLDIGDCKRCRLSEARHSIVFGSGNERSAVVFVGEGPGADEDEQGLPFVGRAGQLLTQMIDNTASKEGIPIRREDVYICNVVKCRPPENRTPLPDEMQTCGQFLYRQLNTIKPKAICALGSTAMKALLNVKEGITKQRGKWHKWQDIPVMVTYHPSYLLRQYNQQARREAWEDLKTLFHFAYD